MEATPSEEAAEALAAEERELVRSREQELGPEGLEKAQEMIEAAQEENPEACFASQRPERSAEMA